MSLIAVGYLRRSTSGQEASINEQAKAVQEYATSKGYGIIRWYTDDAISGDDTERRLDFKKMLADAQEFKDFEYIICWDQSRFGRFSPQEAGHWTYLFSMAGVQLVTVDKGLVDWNDFTAWLTYSVNQHSKHDFLKQLSKDVVRGQKEAVAQGSWLGSPPYGYRIEGERKNKRLVIDDLVKVKVVERIFREFVVDGRSMSNIADRLHAEGYVAPGSRCRPWRFDSVRIILENPAYCGDYASGRYSYGKFNSILPGRRAKVGSRIKNAESQWIVRRDNHESIIDRDTFEQAQQILAKGKTGRSPYSPEENPFILNGLLRCGKCGGPMWGDRNGSRLTYECGVWQYHGVTACEGTKVKEHDILAGVADHLRNEFFEIDGVGLADLASKGELTADNLPEAFAKIKHLIAPPAPKQPAIDRRRIESRVKKLGEAITKAQTNLIHLDPENIPVAQNEIKQLKTERGELERELLKKLPTERNLNTQSLEILRSLWWLRHLFASAAQAATMKSESDWLDLADEVRGMTGCVPAFMRDAAHAPELKRYLKNIVKVVCHSQKRGNGKGTRHEFLRGEIVFRVGGVTRESNPHRGTPNSFSFVFGPSMNRGGCA